MRYASRRVNAPQIEDRRVAAQTEGRAHERSEVAARRRAARVLGGVVDGCFLSLAAVEGSKERDEGARRGCVSAHGRLGHRALPR